MRERQTTVYYCDHCSKKGFYKRTISRHEQTCFGNPDNVPACLQWQEGIKSQCVHLSRTTPDAGPYFCMQFKKSMHSKRSEVMGYDIPEDSTLMPKQCFAYQPDIEIINHEAVF